MKEFSRLERVSELIRRELGVLIDRHVDDPRVRFVSITAVKVSRDLRNARVYVTQIDTAGDKQADTEALQKASGYLRRQLAAVLPLKNVPALTFVYDESVKRGADLSMLIERTMKEEDGH